MANNSDYARAGIVARGDKIGVDWQGEIEALRTNIGALEQEYEHLTTESTAPTKWPDYYLKEFHGYDVGNLGWLPAFEVGPAALAVHAPIFTESNRDLRQDGDATLRGNYHEKMKEALRRRGSEQPRVILDIGCKYGAFNTSISKELS